MNIKFDVTKHEHDIYQFSGSIDDQMYLVLGTQKAAVIDTGIGLGSLKEQVRNITNLPLVILNTHGHPDHAGGNGQFEGDEIYLHPNDVKLYQKMCTEDFRRDDLVNANGESGKSLFPALVNGLPETKSLTEGMVIDLGGRTLTVFEVPGHTMGSVCMFDSLSKALFVGDVLTLTPTWLHLDHCGSLSMHLYSLRRLKALHLPFSVFYPGHLPVPVDTNVMDKKIACSEAILANPKIGSPIETFAGNGLFYEHDSVSIIYNPDNL